MVVFPPFMGGAAADAAGGPRCHIIQQNWLTRLLTGYILASSQFSLRIVYAFASRSM